MEPDRESEQPHDPPMARAERPLVVVANRLPVRFDERQGAWIASPGGLVSALRPVAERRCGTWVGWNDSARPPPRSKGLRLHAADIRSEDAEAYYAGCSNSTLWPALHGLADQVEQRRDWWESYFAVNDQFADAVAAVAPPASTVWLHDYHLLAAPSRLAALRPDLRLGLFLHTPFADPCLFGQLDGAERLLDGLRAVELVGTQTCQDAARLRSLLGDTTTTVRPHPISVDAALLRSVAGDPAVRALAERLRRRLGGGRRILLGVDRLDYTKGIPERLEAFRSLVENGDVSVDEVVFVQIAAPSRQDLPAYRRLTKQVDELVRSFDRLARSGHGPAVHLIHENVAFRELVAHYLAADIAVVTPHRDGMNLVCKEFAVARDGDAVTLVLSGGAGAANELADAAVVVDGADVSAVAAGMLAALRMPAAEQVRRSRRLAQQVTSHDVHRWAEGFLTDLERGGPAGQGATSPS